MKFAEHVWILFTAGVCYLCLMLTGPVVFIRSYLNLHSLPLILNDHAFIKLSQRWDKWRISRKNPIRLRHRYDVRKWDTTLGANNNMCSRTVFRVMEMSTVRRRSRWSADQMKVKNQVNGGQLLKVNSFTFTLLSCSVSSRPTSDDYHDSLPACDPISYWAIKIYIEQYSM